MGRKYAFYAGRYVLYELNYMELEIPKDIENNTLLAYEVGLHIGDGNICHVPYKYMYRISYLFNLKEETIFVNDIVMPLLETLYHCRPNTFSLKDNTILISIYSKKLFEFKTRMLGLPVGKKIDVAIPEIFLKSREMKVNTLAGVFDSDGCMKFMKEKHNYPQIRISNISKKLMCQIKDILVDLEISSTLYKRPDNVYVLDINGTNNLKKYVRVCPFKNHTHLTKLSLWERDGFCPPNLSISERMNILGP